MWRNFQLFHFCYIIIVIFYRYGFIFASAMDAIVMHMRSSCRGDNINEYINDDDDDDDDGWTGAEGRIYQEILWFGVKVLANIED